MQRIRRPRDVRRARRGFNLVELLIALAISSALLTATLVALDASFVAYQRTTEQASTHTIGRLAMHRITALVRAGTEFWPKPVDPLDRTVESNFIDVERLSDGVIVSIEWLPDEERLVYSEDGGEQYTLLEGVIEQIDPETGLAVPPFVLEYENGSKLYRVTLDLSIVPDDDMDTDLDGDWSETIRLVASAMPRTSAYEP